MRILHISTSDSGGAGTAALRQHIALMKAGVDSKFLCLNKNTIAVPEVYQFKPVHNQAIKKMILNRFGFSLPKPLLNESIIKGKKGEYEIFSFPNTEYKVHKHYLVNEADIINLHWIADFIDYPSFFCNVKKPIVWTLHDMSPFLGGFHYQNDKLNNLNEWGSIELQFEAIKRSSINKHKNIHVVTPSNWLGNFAAKSEIFKKRPIYRNYYNCLDFDIFKPLCKDASCEVLGIPKIGKKIFFVAGSLRNKRKGFDLLLEALHFLKYKDKVTLITVGSYSNNIVSNSIKCINLGLIKDPLLLNIAYNSADCFVIPSREDNLPNVMIEALACGLPVISFPVGGMAEVIKTGKNGILTTELTSKSLSEALQDFLDDKYNFSPTLIREEAFKTFNMQCHSFQYIQLYNDIQSLNKR